MALKGVTIRTVLALKPGQTIWDADHREAVRGFGVRRQRGNPFYPTGGPMTLDERLRP
jgi:hypothetical protein